MQREDVLYSLSQRSLTNGYDRITTIHNLRRPSSSHVQTLHQSASPLVKTVPSPNKPTERQTARRDQGKGYLNHTCLLLSMALMKAATA